MATRPRIRRLFNRTLRTVRNESDRFRPRLEALEDRTLLSNAATAGDLITAIQNANTAGATTTITLAANTTFDFTFPDNLTDGANACRSSRPTSPSPAAATPSSEPARMRFVCSRWPAAVR